MLQALALALTEAAQSDYLTDQVTDQVARLLSVLGDTSELSASELMSRLELSHRASFRSTYLGPALVSGCVEMTDPDSPRSPAQKYRLTGKGRVRIRP
ncbi:Fic family protein [Pseudomonas gingeri]|uniref:Fic family protein n=1 Tax=Pseudomonas gingeri TaxID=117681 RepID=UPI0035294CDD